MLTKEECERAYTDFEISRAVLKRALENNCELINPIPIFDKATVIFARLIHEHFLNPPLKFDELQERETYYHVYYGWISIRCISDCECILINTLNSDGYKQIEFEEDCFYRKEVQE